VVGGEMSSVINRILRDYQQLSIRYNAEETSVWLYMKPTPRPCFNPTLLSEIKQFQESVIHNHKMLQAEGSHPINYVVSASHVPGVFNLGGDLNLFAQYILSKDRDHLLRYAIACIDVLHNNAINLDLPVTTISLVEGSALGGGFEAAVSSNVVIAERSTEMGLPEILFNLFPGMGAYSLLARRIGMVEAEKMITSGKVYRAEELLEMGIVDVLADDGEGRNEVNNYIKQHMRTSNGLRAIQAVRKRYNPISYQELLDITKIWVDAALNLTKKDLRMMQRLVSVQDKRRSETVSANGNVHMIRTKQDRRISSEIQFPYSDSQGNVISNDRRRNAERRLEYLVKYLGSGKY
jgi:DSF synthase